MHQLLEDLLNDHRPWPQFTESTSLRPDDFSSAIPALREILQRTGMLVSASAVVLDNMVTPHIQAVKQEDNNDIFRYTPELVETVKHFQQWQGLFAKLR